MDKRAASETPVQAPIENDRISLAVQAAAQISELLGEALEEDFGNRLPQIVAFLARSRALADAIYETLEDDTSADEIEKVYRLVYHGH